MLYHFSVGNSDTGPVGMAGIIRAKTRREAIEKLDNLLPEYTQVYSNGDEYVNVYFNGSKVKIEEMETESTFIG